MRILKRAMLIRGRHLLEVLCLLEEEIHYLKLTEPTFLRKPIFAQT